MLSTSGLLSNILNWVILHAFGHNFKVSDMWGGIFCKQYNIIIVIRWKVVGGGQWVPSVLCMCTCMAVGSTVRTFLRSFGSVFQCTRSPLAPVQSPRESSEESITAMKRVGERTDPCLMPWLTGKLSEHLSLIFTTMEVPVYQSLINRQYLPLTSMQLEDVGEEYLTKS